MAAGDDELLEDPHDRAFARAVSGRIQYATVEQLGRTTDTLRDVDSKIDGIVKAIAEHRLETKEVRGWLEGTTSANGDQTPGILAQVREFGSLKIKAMWFAGIIVVAVTTTAAAAVTNAFINLSNHAALVNATTAR